jgi:hypothetical protein
MLAEALLRSTLHGGGGQAAGQGLGGGAQEDGWTLKPKKAGKKAEAAAAMADEATEAALEARGRKAEAEAMARVHACEAREEALCQREWEVESRKSALVKEAGRLSVLEEGLAGEPREVVERVGAWKARVEVEEGAVRAREVAVESERVQLEGRRREVREEMVAAGLELEGRERRCALREGEVARRD